MPQQYLHMLPTLDTYTSNMRANDGRPYILCGFFDLLTSKIAKIRENALERLDFPPIILYNIYVYLLKGEPS